MNENQRAEPVANPEKSPDIVIVGNYKARQLDWIEKNGVYNYPVREEDEFTPETFAKIRELWLYANVKSERHVFAAQFIGKMTKDEFLAAHPSYAKLGPSRHDTYYVFKTTLIDYPEDRGSQLVIARADDFGGYSARVKKAILQFKQDGEYAPLADYLPKELGNVPRQQLRVCEAAIQLDFLSVIDKQAGLLQEGDPMNNVVSLFSGAGGLDLGFEKAGFFIVWANEFDKDIWATYRANHKKTYLCTKSICDVDASEIPDCVGIIGGPPCQSWSEGGAKRGINDKRGQLFFDYIRILKAKRPLFFLAENVSGMLLDRHHAALEEIKKQFMEAGYNLSFTPVNAWDYGVPQDRERVLFVGYRKDIGKTFKMPTPIPLEKRKTIRDAIGDLENIMPGMRKNGLVEQTHKLAIPNHEFMTGGFSSIFMSRNRVRAWDEPAFTVQAGGRQSQLHPSAPKMVKIDEDKFEFKKGAEAKYRRISVREAARIQTFPDTFIFHYDNIAHGYKMIGNAVPVELAKIVAKQIRKDLEDFLNVNPQ